MEMRRMLKRDFNSMKGKKENILEKKQDLTSQRLFFSVHCFSYLFHLPLSSCLPAPTHSFSPLLYSPLTHPAFSLL